MASLAELISSGEPVLALCADAARRARLASEAADPRRFGAALPRIACCRCGSVGLDDALSQAPAAGLVLADWTSVALRPQTPLAFRHVVLVDPPPSEPLEALAWAATPPAAAGGGARSYIHLAWGQAEADLAERVFDWEWNLRTAIREVWRSLAATEGEASGAGLRSLLAGDSAYPRTPELAARCVRVLGEVGLCQWLPDWRRSGVAGLILGEDRSGAIAGLRGLRRQTPGGHSIPPKQGTTDVASTSTDGKLPTASSCATSIAVGTRAWASRPAGRGPRARTPITRELTADQRALLGDLFAVIEEHKSDVAEPIDREEIERAFAFACESHAGQERKSGEDFITHPLGVARICAGMRLDTATLCAALLHDTVEDTSASLEQVREDFGDEIAQLVDGVTKLTGITFKSRDERQAENYRKMMVAMATDVRVILIKLADRLHNMRTIGALPKQKQQEKARETLEIFAPLAHRLGIHAIKWELEDLAFATLHPRKYDEIKELVAQQRAERERYVEEAGEFLAEELGKVGIEAEISGRAKHFYSIYTKMTRKGREFNEIFDLTAMRVLVGSVKDCYGAIGIVHSLWKPLPGRFKDFVAMPKANAYQALHTTVIGPEGRPLEIQIRTPDMHELAEYGIAAHVIYKEGSSSADPGKEKMTWLRQLLENEQHQGPQAFLEALKVDLFEDEVFVFTPKGEVKNLAAGSTPLDFAYSIHTDVGHRCVGAKVNGKIVPLHYQLSSGDIVEVLTAKQGRGPSRDWLKLVRTSRAPQQDPRLVLARGPRGRRAQGPRGARSGLQEARPALPEAGRVAAPGRRDPRDGLPQGGRLLHRAGPVEDLHQGRGQQGDAAPEAGRGGRGGAGRGADQGHRRRAAPRPSEATRLRDQGQGHRGRRGAPRQVLPPGSRRRGRRLRLARARDHRPPRGLPQRRRAEEGAGAVHRGDWDGDNESSYRVELQVDAWDRTRLLEDLSRTFAEAGLNILEARCATKHPMVKNRFVLEVGDTEQLKQCISRLRNLDSVFDAYRVTPTA